MRIFLDTANIEEIRQGVRLGVVSGVTTNPSLVAKEGIADYKSGVQRICALLPEGDVSAEVTAEDVGGMLAQGRQIAAWAPNVLVKIPATLTGLEVISVLAKENLDISMERLRLGQTTSLEMRQAQDSYVESMTRLITIEYNLKVAETKLKQLTAEE
jgi:hypothetical protein